MKEIIEKHFQNMVDDILEHSETYEAATTELLKIGSANINIPLFSGVARSLKLSIRQKALSKKTSNHQD